MPAWFRVNSRLTRKIVRWRRLLGLSLFSAHYLAGVDANHDGLPDGLSHQDEDLLNTALVLRVIMKLNMICPAGFRPVYQWAVLVVGGDWLPKHSPGCTWESSCTT